MTRSRTLAAMLVTAAIASVSLAACADDTADAGGGPPSGTPPTRTVDGAYGAIEVPAEPRRIVGDLMTVDYLSALGFDTSRIVGVFDAGFFRAAEGHYLAEVFAREDLVDPGFQHDVNVEALAAADPDLIVVPFDQIDGSEQIDEIAAVAPLLVVPTSEGQDPAVRYGGTASFQDWRGTLRAYGELFDLQAEAEAYIDGTEALLEAVTEEHAGLIASITATEAKSTPDFLAINALNPARTSGVLGTILMSELGFRPPPQQADVAPDDYGTIDVSLERTDLLDGDLLFLEVRDGATRHEESPLWATLDVVRDGGVVIVGNHWEYGGALAARHVVADLEAALDELAARR